ncbi:ABC-2 transporter permease [uncultured Clostridium sp.]|uniref:ABC-2 transporter permease n=1 Tax=uncultured Clostridium sp. TaxID=59620 RepID=UPI00258D3501|nr:ABC-2 transporter permease [uncultured Clostridium sp.]
MSRIINLIFLQFETLFSLKKYMTLIIGLAIFMVFIQPDMLPFAGAMFIMATCYNTAFYEEKSKVNYLIYSLPVKSTEYILSKYIFVAINTLISIGILSIIYKIMLSFQRFNVVSKIPLWAFILVLAGIGIFMMTILVPLQVLLNFEKARIVLVFLTVFPIVYSTELTKILPTVNLNNNIFKILIILCIVTLILVSYFITSNLYLKKDIE